MRLTVEQLEDRLVPSATWIEQGPGVITGNPGVLFPPYNNSIGELAAQNNPSTGAVEAIAVDPTNANIGYAGSVNGGVWRTDNLTAANPLWRPLTDQQLPFLDISSLAVSPVNHNEIFAGTGPTTAFGGLFGAPGFGAGRSLDGGKHWQVLGADVLAGQTIRSIVPTSLNDGQVVLAASFLAVNGFVAPTEGGGVYRSTDGGVTWTQLSGALGTGLPAESVSDLVADPGNPERFYAAVDVVGPLATGKEGVYRSDDGGLTWTQVNNGLTGLDTSARILLSVHNSAAGNAVYAMVIDQNGGLEGVFRSADHGANWTALGTPSLDIFPGGQGAIWHGAIEADPHDPYGVFISGDSQIPPNANGATDYSGVIFRGDASQPSGSVWTSACSNGANHTSPHADSRALVFDDNGNLLEASDGGVARLDHPNDASVRQWSFISFGLADVEFHNVAYDPLSKVIIGGTQDNGSPTQLKPGQGLWDNTRSISGDGGVVQVDANQTAHPGTSIRYASAQYLEGFNRSTWDANNNFLGSSFIGLNIVAGPGAGNNLETDLALALQFFSPIAVNSVDPTRMLIGTDTLYESFDQGDSLTNLNFSNGSYVGASPSSLSLQAFANGYGQPMAYGGRLGGVGNPDVIWAGIGNQIVYREHLGDPLQVVSGYHGDLVETIVADPQNYRRIFVVDHSNQVWASFDAGKTFHNLTANLSRLTPIVTTIEVVRTGPSAADIHIVAGAANGVFALGPSDGEQPRWHRLGDNLPHALVMDLRYSATDNLLLAGTLGRGAWTLANPFGEEDSNDAHGGDGSVASSVPGVPLSTLVRDPRVFDALFTLIGKANADQGAVNADAVFPSGNSAAGQGGRSAGTSAGGGESQGFSTNAAALVSFDALTLADVINNTAFTSDNDVFGPFAIIP
jgi:hypothetical protein